MEDLVDHHFPAPGQKIEAEEVDDEIKDAPEEGETHCHVSFLQKQNGDEEKDEEGIEEDVEIRKTPSRNDVT